MEDFVSSLTHPSVSSPSVKSQEEVSLSTPAGNSIGVCVCVCVCVQCYFYLASISYSLSFNRGHR